MVAFTILAGGYGLFVATYSFNSDTSSLSVLSRSATGENPSWIAKHPSNSSVLYAVNEVDKGAVQSFLINPDGSLSDVQDTVLTNGGSPAHVAPLSGGRVGVMNYNGGNGRIIPTVGNPLIFDKNAPTITFATKAGTVSHPHMVLEHNDEIFIPDLGQDTIWQLSSNSNSPSVQGSLPQPGGSGPRHSAIYQDRLFTIHELDSTLGVQTLPSSPRISTQIINSTSIIPPNTPQGSIWAAGEVKIPKPTTKFPNPYIYASNRNLGTQDPRGDSIAIYELINKGRKDEQLKLVNHVYTGLNQIRSMEFGSSSNEKGGEEFLVAAGVAGNAGTVVLKRVDGGRNMKVVARNLDIPTRTSFVWL